MGVFVSTCQLQQSLLLFNERQSLFSKLFDSVPFGRCVTFKKAHVDQPSVFPIPTRFVKYYLEEKFRT